MTDPDVGDLVVKMLYRRPDIACALYAAVESGDVPQTLTLRPDGLALEMWWAGELVGRIEDEAMTPAGRDWLITVELQELLR